MSGPVPLRKILWFAYRWYMDRYASLHHHHLFYPLSGHNGRESMKAWSCQ